MEFAGYVAGTLAHTLCPKNFTHMACYNFDVHKPILIIFGKMLLKKYALKRCFIFLLRLTSVSGLPGETENRDVVSFYLNVAGSFANKHKKNTQKISPGQWLQLKYRSL